MRGLRRVWDGAAMRIGRQMRVSVGDAHSECAALSRETLHLNGPTMEFHQFLHERRANPRALVGPSRRAPSMRWNRSNRRGSSYRRDADPRVADDQFNVFAQHRADCTAISPVNVNLNALRQQVEHDLFPHVAIDRRVIA